MSFSIVKEKIMNLLTAGVQHCKGLPLWLGKKNPLNQWRFIIKSFKFHGFSLKLYLQRRKSKT